MILSPTATRELLARLGHEPRSALGQNFLVDGNLVRKSIALAEIRPAEAVVEIGPGLGTLTSGLLEAGAEVWAIERDRTLFAHLNDTLMPAFGARLHLKLGDAVEDPLAGLPPARAADAKIVANLPYAISSPWLDMLLSGPLPGRLVLMLQREAARRLTAAPGSKAYGAISIFLQSAYRTGPGHPVAATCFFPRPEVDSVLLLLHRLSDPFVFSPSVRSAIRGIFQQRRKQLGALIRRRASPSAQAWLELVSAAGFPPRSRPEEIPPVLWQQFPISVP